MFRVSVAALAAIHFTAFAGVSQITAFTYQGRLNDGTNPATGIYDLRFTIYDSTNLPGTLIAGPLTNNATAVSNGLFTTALDFGIAFDGTPRWLEIAVRTNGSASDFITLAPRQQLTPTPSAIYASSAGMAVSAGTAATASSVAAINVTGTLALNQLPGAVLTNNQSGVSLMGTFAGNGLGLTNLNSYSLTGPLSIQLATVAIGHINTPTYQPVEINNTSRIFVFTKV